MVGLIQRDRGAARARNRRHKQDAGATEHLALQEEKVGRAVFARSTETAE